MDMELKIGPFVLDTSAKEIYDDKGNTVNVYDVVDYIVKNKELKPIDSTKFVIMRRGVPVSEYDCGGPMTAYEEDHGEYKSGVYECGKYRILAFYTSTHTMAAYFVWKV